MARKAKLRLSPYSIPLVKGWAGFVADVVIHPDRLSVGPNFVEVMEKDRSKTERELAEYRAPYIVKNKFIVPIYDFKAWLRHGVDLGFRARAQRCGVLLPAHDGHLGAGPLQEH